MAKSLPKIVIFGDPKKGDLNKAITEFTAFIKGKAKIVASCGINDCTIDLLKGVDYAIVFGGDGSLISAARQLSQMNVPVIGVNLGKLGFLAEFSIDELEKYFNDIIAKKVNIEKRMMLSCHVSQSSKEIFRSEAINDIVINAGPPFRMIEMKITVDEQPLTGCISDGLVISTPTGSTAYNISAGGPILSDNMEGIVITPLCPHSLSFRPIVINANSKVNVYLVRANEGTTLSADGQVSRKLGIEDVVTIKRAREVFRSVHNPMRTRWDTLASKLNWAEPPKYRNTGVII